jgi:hypothetical protein
MEIGAEQFRDFRAVSFLQYTCCNRPNLPTYMSSSGDIKMSLKLMTCGCSAELWIVLSLALSYVFMLEMLQQLQLSVCSLGQDWRAEGLHDLLYRHRLSSELILRRAVHRD